jgi:hypothetical protein
MKEGVESLGRVRAQAMVLLVIAFLGGAFVGGTIDQAMRWPSRTRALSRGGFMRGGGPSGRGGAATRGPRPPGALPGSYELLGLSADQHTKIEAILAKRSARVDSAMKSVCVVIGPARDSTSKEIEAVLTADQRTKRDSIRTARMAVRGPSGPGGPGGPRGTFGCGGVAAPRGAQK